MKSIINIFGPSRFARRCKEIEQAATGAYSKKGGIFLSPEKALYNSQGNALGKTLR